VPEPPSLAPLGDLEPRICPTGRSDQSPTQPPAMWLIILQLAWIKCAKAPNSRNTARN